jgi:hypothetical protein
MCAANGHSDLKKMKVAFKRILPEKTNEKSNYRMKFYVILEMRTGCGLNLNLNKAKPESPQI